MKGYCIDGLVKYSYKKDDNVFEFLVYYIDIFCDVGMECSGLKLY